MDPIASGNPAEGAGAPPAGPNQGQQAAADKAAADRQAADKAAADKPAADKPETIHLLAADYQRLHGELDELRKKEAERTAEIDRQRHEVLQEAAKKANVEKALQELKEGYERRNGDLQARYLQLESEIHSEKLGGAINDALAGVELVQIPGVDPSIIAAQVRRLLSDEIESVRGNDGKFRVQDRKMLRPAGEYLKERIGSPEFAHYIKAPSKGGSGTGDSAARPGQQQANMPGQQPGKDDPLAAVVADWQNRQTRYQSMGLRPTVK